MSESDPSVLDLFAGMEGHAPQPAQQSGHQGAHATEVTDATPAAGAGDPASETGIRYVEFDVDRVAEELRTRLGAVRRAWAQYQAAGEVSQDALDFEARL